MVFEYRKVKLEDSTRAEAFCRVMEAGSSPNSPVLSMKLVGIPREDVFRSATDDASSANPDFSIVKELISS